MAYPFLPAPSGQRAPTRKRKRIPHVRCPSLRRENVKRKRLRFGKGFRVVFGNRSAQAAEMVLLPVDSEGSPGNRHRGADQWLYVVSGRGTALANGRRKAIAAGTLVLIERRDLHEVRALGKEPLRTLNIYVPPAYTKAGDPLPRGRK